MREEIRTRGRLFRGVVGKKALLMYRYPINTLASIVTIYVFFLLTLFGGRAIGGGAFDDSLASIVVGFFLVTASISAYNSLANSFAAEASWGTLEQLYMCRSGFGLVAVFVAVAEVLVAVVTAFSLLVAMLLTTGIQLRLNLLSTLVTLVLSVSSVIGVGFVFGGAAVVYKRIGNVFNIVQFGFVGLIAAPVETYPVLKLLPLAQGSYLLRRIMTEDAHLWTFAQSEVAILVVTGVGYALLGYLVMLRFVRLARSRGVMGHY